MKIEYTIDKVSGRMIVIPFIIGTADLAAIPLMTLVGVILSLVFAVVLGVLGLYVPAFLSKVVMVMISIFAFAFGCRINNIEQMSYLGVYYYYKVRGATYEEAGEINKAPELMGKAYCRLINCSIVREETCHSDLFRNLSITSN